MHLNLDLLYRILGKRNEKYKVWIFLPINHKFQETKQIIFKHDGFGHETLIDNKRYKYLYLKTNSEDKINVKIKLKLKEIRKYKDNIKNEDIEIEKNIKIILKKEIKNLKIDSAYSIYNWIVKNIKFPKNLVPFLKNLNRLPSIKNILKNKEAECTGKSLLFVYFCRALGIPARIVNGYFIKNGKVKLFNSKLNLSNMPELHTWAEFYENNLWIPVDCQLAQDEKKNYFGKFNDYRVIVTIGTNYKLINNGLLKFTQIGKIVPKGNLEISVRFSQLNQV